MASNVASSAEVILANTTNKSGTIQLPLTTSVPYRVLTIKDPYGTFGTNSLTIQTQGADVFGDGTTTKTFRDNFTYVNLYANAAQQRWNILSATQTPSLTVSSIVGISSIQGGVFIGDGSQLSNISVGGAISSLSSVISYGLSSLATGSTNPGVSSLSSIVSYSFSSFSTSYTLSFTTSSLTASSLLFGVTTGFVTVPALQAIALSSIQTNTNILNVGTIATLASISSVNIQASTITVGSNITVGCNISAGGAVTATTGTITTLGATTGTITTLGATTGTITTLNTTGIATIGTANISNTLTNYLSMSVIGYTGSQQTTMINTNLKTAGPIYITGGTSSPAYYSFNLTTWQQVNNTNNIQASATNNSIIITSARSTNIQYSYDGITYFNATTPSSPGLISGFVYAQSLGLWVGGPTWNYGTGTNSIWWSSNNGINWNNIISGGFTSAYAFGGVGWNGSNMFVATAGPISTQSNTILFSPDGKNWSNALTGGFYSNYGGQAVAYNNSNLWVVVGLSSNILNTVQTSTDGMNWSNITSGGFTIGSSFPQYASSARQANGGYGVTYVSQYNLWLAGGTGGSSNSNIQYSSNGTTWFPTTGAALTNYCVSFQWTGSNIIAYGATGGVGTLLSSSNGINWTTLNTTIGTVPVGGPYTFLIYSNTANTNLTISSITTNSLQVGNTSTISGIFYAGLSNTYNRTVVAEQSNSATSQELLLYKGGTSTDNIRAQTTGNILLEAGVGARTWPTNTAATAASVYISGTAGTGLTQVGINTNTPGATLDVALTSGTASIRAPLISSLQMFTSSIIANSINLPTYSYSSIFAQTVSAGILNISTLNVTQLNVNTLSTNIYSVSTLNTNYISSGQATFSSLIVNAMQFGTGDGYVDFGAIRSVVVSSIQTNTGILNATQVQASTINATLFPVYYNTIISTVGTGNTMYLPTSAAGSYLFITSAASSGSNVFVSLPTTSVPSGSLFVIKHKGATGGTNFVNIQNTASVLAASTTTTAIYSGIEWLSLGVSGIA